MPSHDRSVVDSPADAAAYRYAALHRLLVERASRCRSSARPTVMGEADRLSSTVAPASAALALGGTGTHMSSQISTYTASPGTSSASKTRSGPKGRSPSSSAPGQCGAWYQSLRVSSPG